MAIQHISNDNTVGARSEAPIPAIGFCLSLRPALQETAAAESARTACLRHFPWLHCNTATLGSSTLEYWSHSRSESALWQAPDGSRFLLIGSPTNRISWRELFERLAKAGEGRFELPWEGRCILLRISPDGRDWSIWNDWCGAIQVFHAGLRQGAVVSTSEPMVVAAAGLNPGDFSKRGIVELLVYGHFIHTDTLYSKMQILPADSHAVWKNGVFQGAQFLGNIAPSDARWGCGRDELVEEMHEHLTRVIGAALQRHPAWTLPLSGGLDSRIIACIAADTGTPVNGYTWGPSGWYEVIYAAQLSKLLNLPWKRVGIGVDYLTEYTGMWFDWFGSALHPHGMYHMPFLKELRSQARPILSGFLGNSLAGDRITQMSKKRAGRSGQLGAIYQFWRRDELRELLLFDPSAELEEIEALLARECGRFECAEFQKLVLLDLFVRQRGFVSYYPTMHDYWKGAATPYMDRRYVRFCLSLPRLALEGRQLQIEMLCRYWPKAAAIQGTFTAPEPPARLTRSWLLKKGMASLLPKFLRVGPLREFAPRYVTMSLDCLRAHGWEALYPMSPTMDGGDLLNQKAMTDALEGALHYDSHDYDRVRALQALVYRMKV